MNPVLHAALVTTWVVTTMVTAIALGVGIINNLKKLQSAINSLGSGGLFKVKTPTKVIEEAKIRQVVIMMTINSLCLFSITEFLDDMLSLKAKYGTHKPIVDFNILRWPAFMSPLTLPNDIKYESTT